MMGNLLAALSIEGWCNDHTWAILSRVLPEGATICGAPGRWGPSKNRARSTKKQRPPSTSRRNIVPHSPIFIICWCRISGMGVYKQNQGSIFRTELTLVRVHNLKSLIPTEPTDVMLPI
jgi:hypothetical protein